MKFRLYIVAISLIATTSVNAMDNEPDGFRGIQWGALVNSVEGMIETPDAARIQRFVGTQNGVNLQFPIKSYIRRDDKREFNGVPVASTIYTFYKDRFVGVLMQYQSNIDLHPSPGQKYPDYQNQRHVDEALVKYFGPSDRSKLSFFDGLNFSSSNPTYAGMKTNIISNCTVLDHKSTSTRAACELQFKSVELSNQVRQDWQDYLAGKKSEREDGVARAKSVEAAKPDF